MPYSGANQQHCAHFMYIFKATYPVVQGGLLLKHTSSLRSLLECA